MRWAKCLPPSTDWRKNAIIKSLGARRYDYREVFI